MDLLVFSFYFANRFWFIYFVHPSQRENPLWLSQGFKVVIRDIGLHMSNRVMDYSNEDGGLCRGALESRRGSRVPPMKTDFSSVQEYLESSQFVQVSHGSALPREVALDIAD